MAKATYYVTDGEVSEQLGAKRSKVYDPKRPPAASKATVAAVGNKGERIAVDMIAVPKPAR